jgi:putative transposase
VVEGIYHVWFSTKARRQALDGELGDDARGLLTEVAQRTGIRLLEIEVAADHVHMLVAVTGGQTLSSVMHQLKGASARLTFLKYSDLKMDLGGASFWQKGYGFRKVDPKEVTMVASYIRTQTSRPLRHGQR